MKADRRILLGGIISIGIIFSVIIWNLTVYNQDSAVNRYNNPNSTHGDYDVRSISRSDNRMRTGSDRIVNRDQGIEGIWVEGSLESNLVGDLLEPFNPAELTKLAKTPSSNDRRLIDLILRAAANKDKQFIYLLDDQTLKSNLSTRLALAIYDFSINDNATSLNYVINQHVEAKMGWDTDTIMVLAYVDEWDLTKKAFNSHYMSQDGSGATSAYNFWLTRRYLFPYSKSFKMSFKDFEKAISIAQEKIQN